MDDLLDKFAQLLGAYSQAADDEIQAIEDDDFEAIREANDERAEAAKELADFLREHGPMVTFADAAPEPSAAATAPFEIGDHVKHHDGTTGQVVGISCESGWLHVLWDNSRACLWWSPAATTLLDEDLTSAPFDPSANYKREEGGDGQQ